MRRKRRGVFGLPQLGGSRKMLCYTGRMGASPMLHSLRCSTVVAMASAILAGTALLAAAQPPPEPPSSSGGSLFGPAQANAKSVVTVRAQFTAPAADQPGRLWITATIAPGWHIYSITQPPGGPLATKIEVSPPRGVRRHGQVRIVRGAQNTRSPMPSAICRSKPTTARSLGVRQSSFLRALIPPR